MKWILACAALGWLCWSAGNRCQAQTAAPGLSPDLQEVVRLAQAKMPDDVIKNYVASTGKTYRLTVDDIIYLNGQGVSAGVISTLQATSLASPGTIPAPATTSEPTVMQAPPTAGTSVAPAPAMVANPPPATVMTAPPGQPEINFQYFHDQLAPFGTWVNIEGVMYWRPDAALAVNPDWRPYYDMGQWVQTENGLYWQSDYTWGDIPFHYGRWILYPGMGWLWQPDYLWGPAWVFWRHDEADACIGWAPLPPGAVFVEGGFRYHGVVVGLDFDFGLGEACFTFVGYDHFHERFVRMRDHEWVGHVDHGRLHGFYQHSVIRNEFRRDDHGRFVNNGIGRDRIDHLTHVERTGFEERNPVGDRSHLGEAGHRTEPVANHGAPEHVGTHAGAPEHAGASAPHPGGATPSHTAGTAPNGPGAAHAYRPPTGGGSQGAQKDRH